MADQTARPFLSVVIPAYNEARRLPDTLARVVEFLAHQKYPSQVLVVDDGSTDETARGVEEFCAANPRVALIRNEHRGKGFAVRTGVQHARGEIILLFDADSSTPIEDVEKLLPWFERGYAIVIGSREGAGAKRISEPFYRHVMGRVFNFVVRAVTVRGINDTQCGFKALQSDAAHAIFLRAQLYRANAGRVHGAMVTAYDVEVLFLGQKLGYRIKEVPVEWRYGSESKVNPLKDSYRNFRDVVLVR
ncbi:MAG: glycosyltransferase family 2 protein, partial [Chloroflexi bacterium]|nr:glycosyltransferase family 2 protein [Chloroflexota bacterium]